MARRFTPEQTAFVRENAPLMRHCELRSLFADTFGFTPSNDSLYRLKSRIGVKSKTNTLSWTQEMNDYFREITPGHMEFEIQELFEKRFGIKLRISQIANRKNTLGVKSGTFGGRFIAGQASWNKGKSWEEQGWSEESMRRCRASQFKKRWKGGNVPTIPTETPIGTERISKDGYVEVRVGQGVQHKPNCNFRRKHHLVWEEANGMPVPEGHKVIFADGDKRNFDPENLVCIPNSLWVLIVGKGIQYHDRESLMTALKIAELRHLVAEKERLPRSCKDCGVVFTPRFQNQKTCDMCIDARRV